MDDFLVIAKWTGIAAFVLLVLGAVGIFLIGMYRGATGREDGEPSKSREPGKLP